MTRTWRWPDLRNSAGTLNQITDTHFGAGSGPIDGGTEFLQWILHWLDRAREDIEALKITTTAGHVHTGDMIDNWFHLIPPDQFQDKLTAEYALYNAWRQQIEAADGLPFAQAAGNHDMWGGIEADGTRIGETGQSWAQRVGLESVNNAWDMGQMRVLTIGPDRWIDGPDGDPINDFRLPLSTIDWIDAELSSDSRPTFLAAHVPLLAQYPSWTNTRNTADAANPRLQELIGAHSNVVGWLAGHRHNSIQQSVPSRENPPAMVITVAGRQIFTVCAPGGGGGYLDGGSGGAWSRGQYGPDGASCFSTYLTLLDEDTLDVRWRDHLRRRWVQDDPTQARIHLTRSNN